MTPPLYLCLPETAWVLATGRWGLPLAAFASVVVWGLARWRGPAWTWRWAPRGLSLVGLVWWLGAGLGQTLQTRAAVRDWWTQPNPEVLVRAEGGVRRVRLVGTSVELSWERALALTAWRYAAQHAERVSFTE